MKANKSISVNIELSLGGTDVRLSHSVYPSLLMRMCSWSCRRDQGESLISAFKLGSPSTACMRAFAAVVNNLSAAEAPVPWFHMILFASSSPSLAALLYLHSSPFSSPSSSLCFSSSYLLMKEMALFFCWCCVARQQVAPTVAPLDLNMCQWVCVVVYLARKQWGCASNSAVFIMRHGCLSRATCQLSVCWHIWPRIWCFIASRNWICNFLLVSGFD